MITNPLPPPLVLGFTWNQNALRPSVLLRDTPKLFSQKKWPFLTFFWLKCFLLTRKKWEPKNFPPYLFSCYEGFQKCITLGVYLLKPPTDPGHLDFRYFTVHISQIMWQWRKIDQNVSQYDGIWYYGSVEFSFFSLFILALIYILISKAVQASQFRLKFAYR